MNDTILAILVKHQLTPSTELVAVMREVYEAGRFAAVLASLESSTPNEEHDSPLSAADVAELKRIGIDPEKKFRLKTRVFTVVAYKPSRWKYPVTAATQNGTRYKFTIEQIKSYQR